MPVKNFGNNGKNISENTVKLKSEQNIKSLLYIINWSRYGQRRQIFDNFLISLLDKIEDTVHS